MKRPKMLKFGDRIGIVAPAGAAEGQEHIQRVVDKVTSIGFLPVPSDGVLERSGYLAGSDEHRASELNAMIEDETIAGILCLRGGYGAMRILPRLNFSAMSHHPKVLMGYSDITALHLAFLEKSHVVTFHGPCAESSWNDYARQSLRVVMDDKPFGELAFPEPSKTPKMTLYPGRAKGKLIGGNLSLVVSLLGTPYLPSLRGCLLCLEDIGEEPYRVDRMLTQILLSEASRGCRGLVFGNFRDRPRPGEEPTDPNKTFTLEEVLQDRAHHFRLPAYWGISFGHIADNHILPFGVEAELDADGGKLTILEAAVD